MANHISARGHVTAVLVLDMRRFVAPEFHKQFESLRGSPAFLQVLRHVWPALLESRQAFTVAQHPLEGESVAARMPSDEVAFLSGIFRLNTMQDYAVPAYYLRDKARVEFPPAILDNVQFTNVFQEVWRNWEVYVRPTVTGMFVISLRRRYERTTALLKIAADVVSLQTAFDLPGARQRLAEFRARVASGDHAYAAKITSIEAFLTWLDADVSEADAQRLHAAGQPRYAPVQWKLAMEVCRKLVQDVGLQIGEGPHPVRLQVPDRTISTPLHDSFLIYHIDELLAVEPIISKARGAEQDGAEAQLELALGQPRNSAVAPATVQKSPPKIIVSPEDIRRSDELRQQIAGLMEGAVLRKASPAAVAARPAPRPLAQKSYFPDHRALYLDDVFEANAATWSDELCILTGRTAFVMPSRHSRGDELLLSNFSASTGRVMYLWYWEAMERMLELVIEVRVLAHLIERGSANLLREFEQELTLVRHGMSQRDIRVNYAVLTDKVERVANMSRLLGLGLSLSTPTVWGRAEFSVEKARQLMRRQDVPQLMSHAERNVANLNELINHIDELYLADLSESNNRLSFYLSMLLAGLSLSVIVFTVISFWADSNQLAPGSVPEASRALVPQIVSLGNILSLALSAIAIAIICFGIASFTRNMLRARGRRRLYGATPARSGRSR